MGSNVSMPRKSISSPQNIGQIDLKNLPTHSDNLNMKHKPKIKDNVDYDSDPFDDEILDGRHGDIFHISDNDCKKLGLLENDNNLCLPEIIDPNAFNDTFIKQRQRAIDDEKYRKTIDRWGKVKTLKQLVAAIKYHTRGISIIDRTWFVFYWVISNINFDPISLIPEKRADQSADTVFRTRKGVCAGYAYLFKHLCLQVGIKCEYVSGFTKDEVLKHPKRAPVDSNHAWNTVQIGQHWYLVESTWGSGYLTNNRTKFVRNLDFYYFLARPDEFIYSHLPKNDKWQHIKDRINIIQYSYLPNVYPAYFGLRLELVSPRMLADVTLLPGKSFALVIMRAPYNVYISARLTLNDQDVPGGYKIRYSRCNLYYCYFAPAAIGSHKVIIYGYHCDEKNGGHAIELNFDVTQLPNRLLSFPKKWHPFWEHRIEVIYPKNTHAIKLDSLTKNHSQVLIRTPIDIELKGSLINNRGIQVKGGDRVYFDRHKHLWRCKFAPNTKGVFEARILARKKSETIFEPAIAFVLTVDQLELPISYPKLLQRFYDLNLRLLSPTSQTRLTCQQDLPIIPISIRSPANIQLICHMEHARTILKQASFSQFSPDQKHWELLFAPQCAAPHDLIISAQSENSSVEKVAQFYFNMSRYFHPTSFPQVYQSFHTAQCYIYEPIQGSLPFGGTILFRFHLPGAKEVLIELDEDQKTKYPLNESFFQQTIKIGYEKLIVHARFDENYEALVKYSII